MNVMFIDSAASGDPFLILVFENEFAGGAIDPSVLYSPARVLRRRGFEPARSKGRRAYCRSAIRPTGQVVSPPCRTCWRAAASSIRYREFPEQPAGGHPSYVIPRPVAVPHNAARQPPGAVTCHSKRTFLNSTQSSNHLAYNCKVLPGSLGRDDRSVARRR